MRGLLRAGVIGAVTAGVGLALAASPLGAAFEERFGLTWLFALRGPVEAPDHVAVVALDRRSAERLDLPEKIRDWPRDLHADVIKRLDAHGASVIALDLIFEREREPAHDAALVKSIADAGRVVLFEALELQRRPAPVTDAKPATNLQPLGLLETQRLRPPISAFAQAAAGLGPFPLPIVPDRVSQVWLFKPGAGGRPTLPAVTFQRHALSVYREWCALLRVSTAGRFDWLPEDVDSLAKAGNLRRLMIELRRTIQADPALAPKLRASLEARSLAGEKRRLLLALVDLYGGPDSRYLNFYGPAGRMTTLSLADIVEGKADTSLWSGRAAFIGQSELYEPHNDAFITVYSRDDGVKISGVEIAATAFANLADNRLLEPSVYGATAIVAFGVIIGVIAATLPALVAVPVGLAIAGLYLIGAGATFTRDAIWLPTTVPLLAELPLGLFLGLFVQYREARRARQNLSKAIRYYLPEKIAAGFADAPVDPLLLNEEAYAICMIADAGGFTSIAETMTSKQLKPFLEDYLAILFEAVETHGGRVTDSVGDGITAAWTSPAPDPAVAAKACQAALAIDREVQRFNDRHAPLRLPTRIGLNAGRVTLGHVGAAGRFTYTVVGDAVNTASRIEQLNKHLGTRILATKAVVEGVPDLGLRPLGRFQLFGKEEVLEMVEVMKEADLKRKSVILEEFAMALSKYREQHWQTAASLFTEMAGKHKDGAARFYFDMCRRNIARAAEQKESDLIRLEVK